MGLKFGFGRQTWVRVSLKFDLSSSKLVEVHYIWVRSNTNCDKKNLGLSGHVMSAARYLLNSKETL